MKRRARREARLEAVLVGLAEAKQPWFWGIADAVVALLLLGNVLLLLGVHLRRARQHLRRRRERRVRGRIEAILAHVDPAAAIADSKWLRSHLGGFDELERPVAATLLIERLRPASGEERERVLAVLREAGAVERIVRSTGSRMPWRRALAIRTLGWIGADEAVPVLFDRLSDRNRAVREAAVRALGRIGDERALARLGELFRSPGPVGTGVVYDALVRFGAGAEPVFAGALRSAVAPVRVASCFGVAAFAEADAARRLLEPLLDDAEPQVRGAAAESLGLVGGRRVPDALARATRDEHVFVRNAAVAALGAFDDPQAVRLAANALHDPDRETAVRAGEAIVRLSRLPAAEGAAAQELRDRAGDWPVEQARTVAGIGAL